MQIAILGAGMVGRAMAINLAPTYNVTSFDVSDLALQLLTQKNNSIKTIKAGLSNYSNYDSMPAGFYFVISAVPGFMECKFLRWNLLLRYCLINGNWVKQKQNLY